MLRLFFAFLLSCCAGLSLAAVELGPQQTSQNVGDSLQFLRDDAGTLNLAQVQALPASRWQTAESQTFSQGYSQASWWLRFTVRNQDARSPQQLLEIAYPVLDDAEVWLLQGRHTQAHHRLGDKHVFQDRPLKHRFFLIPLELAPGQEYTVLMRVRSTSSLQVPLTLWDEQAYFEQDQLYLLGHGIFFGGMGLVVLYSFFIFIALRDRTYLYYMFYVFSMMMFLASLKGLSFQFLWPTATQWNDRVLIFMLASTVIFGGLFTVRFLRLREHLPPLMPLFRWLIAAAALIVAASFFLPYAPLMQALIMVAGLTCLSFLAASSWRWRAGDRSARYYTIAWSSMLLGGVALALNKFHLLPSNFFTENATQMGCAAEVILLSLAIVDQLNEQRRLRFKAQQDILNSERLVHEAQSQALVAQREANEMLELRVSERTQALEVANRKLEELSATDQLTGVKNRRYLDRVLQDEYARSYRYRHSMALLLLDVDHFKRFNDAWGHQVGDECLRQVAAIIRDTVRVSVDHVARYGGEEFCVVMPETDAMGAFAVAERIRAAVEAMPFSAEGQTVPVTISIGLAAQTPFNSEGSRELLKQADMALYQAKGDGRNRVILAA